MAEEKPLVGDDGAFFTAKLGQEYEGDGTKTLNVLVSGASATSGGDGMYIVTAKANSNSIFPSLLKVGELFPAVGTEVLASGDKVKKLDLTHVADCTGWQFQITQSEIDVTRLKDNFKKYRLGKKDATGTVNSILTLGVSDQSDGMIAKTMKTFRRVINERQTTITVTEIGNDPVYFLGYVNKTDVPGETEAFVFGQVYLYNITLGGSTGNAQSYDSSMRLTGNDPVFYSLDIPSLTA
ncbi:MAG: hypothetical protein IIW99_02085 [Treponema sp.]|nr:hypothetical protein [Treponema sp.]